MLFFSVSFLLAHLFFLKKGRKRKQTVQNIVWSFKEAVYCLQSQSFIYCTVIASTTMAALKDFRKKQDSKKYTSLKNCLSCLLITEICTYKFNLTLCVRTCMHVSVSFIQITLQCTEWISFFSLSFLKQVYWKPVIYIKVMSYIYFLLYRTIVLQFI